MRVLIACEYSGRVRDAFRRHGHDAWSCDLLECEADPHWHYQAPVEDLLANGWDLMIAHPPCTHLAVSGSRHFHRKQREQAEALDFVRLLMAAPIDRWCIENPVSIISSAITPPNRLFSLGNLVMVKLKQHAYGLRTFHHSSPRRWWKAVKPRCIGCHQVLIAGRIAAAPIKALLMPWGCNGAPLRCRHPSPNRPFSNGQS